jgi:hypothetical protein
MVTSLTPRVWKKLSLGRKLHLLLRVIPPTARDQILGRSRPERPDVYLTWDQRGHWVLHVHLVKKA